MSFEDELDAILVKGKDKAAKDILKAVESTYGEVPYIFQFMEDDSELLITKVLHRPAKKLLVVGLSYWLRMRVSNW